MGVSFQFDISPHTAHYEFINGFQWMVRLIHLISLEERNFYPRHFYCGFISVCLCLLEPYFYSLMHQHPPNATKNVLWTGAFDLNCFWSLL